jgi:SAM-dependent methyltransferase
LRRRFTETCLPETYRERMYGAYVRSLRGADELNRPAAMESGSGRPFLERVIKRYFPAERSARIVDLGCGAGQLIHLAKQAGYRAIEGVDVSPEQVARAHALGLAEVRQGDLLETLHAAAAESYDAVVSFDVLEHFTKDEIVPFVDEVRRVLKPGGRWIVHVPNAQSPFGMSVRYGDFTHELAFTAGSLRQLLIASGFASVECYECEPVPHGLRSAGRFVIWKGIKGLLRVWYAAETGEYRARVFTQNMLAVATR